MSPLSNAIATLTFISMPIMAEVMQTEKDNWYQVEVIVFSQQDLYREEKHRTDHQLSYPENVVNLINPSLAGEIQKPYTVLPPSAFQLAPDQTRLKRAPGYRVLYHTAWRQPGLGPEQSPWVLLQSGDSYGSHHELEGSIRLVKNRYLHIQANLWKATFIQSMPPLMMATVQTEGLEVAGTKTQSPEITPSVLPALPSHPQSIMPDEINQLPLSKSNYQVTDIIALEQSTRVKRDETTYLDHPEMGVLVLVSKYEKENTDTITQDTGL